MWLKCDYDGLCLQRTRKNLCHEHGDELSVHFSDGVTFQCIFFKGEESHS